MLTVWLAWLVLMAGANLATPLYAVYAERFGFSALVLTAIFTTYAIVLVPALVLFGRLSDRFGRRPVVAGGLATACVGLVLFRGGAGNRLAVRRPRGAGARRGDAFVLRLPESGEREREPWRPQSRRVPAEIRGPFLRVGLTAGAVWATTALFLSILPSYAESLLPTRNLAVVAAAPSGAAGLLVAGSVVAGVGHGVAFLTAQQELNELAPDERRGEVTAAFIACVYFCVATFVIATGLLGSIFSLDTAIESVGSVLIAVALGAAAWQAASSPADAPRRRAAAPRSVAARR